MPRTIEISVPAATADAVLERVSRIAGVVGLARQPDASIRPPGDVVTILTTNDATRDVMRLLGDLDVLDGGSIRTSEPRSVMSPEDQEVIDRETNETTWDEMAFLLRQDTNIAPNFLVLMGLAGAVAASGLWTGTLHIVIGAMVIAPAFEPLVRLPFGVLVGPREITKSGVHAAAAGYVMLLVGAAIATLLLMLVDPDASQDLSTREWVRFWSTITATGVLTSAFGAAAGAFVISGQRSVLTTGVMIALALVPSLTVTGMAAVVGDLPLAGRGLARWGVDVVLVVVISAAVISVKRLYLQKHRALS